MTRPVLALLPDDRAALSSWFEDTFASLSNYFTLDDAPGDADFAAARAVAAALSEVEHSSDVDCAYYACTLSGPEPGSPPSGPKAALPQDLVSTCLCVYVRNLLPHACAHLRANKLHDRAAPAKARALMAE